jgi:hypothetical protein
MQGIGGALLGGLGFLGWLVSLGLLPLGVEVTLVVLTAVFVRPAVGCHVEGKVAVRWRRGVE